MDWILGRVVDQSHCGASVSNTKITYVVFTDDAVIAGITASSVKNNISDLGIADRCSTVTLVHNSA